MKFSDIVSEGGFLTEKGRELFNKELDLNEILDLATSEDEVRTIGSILCNFVGNRVADYAARFKEKDREVASLWQMTDEEFSQYLLEKYKDSKNELGMFSMSKEELERYKPISKKRFEKFQEEELERKRNSPHYLPPGVNFK